MCYNIPAKATVATVSPEKPGSTICRAVITIPPSVGLLMQMDMSARGKVLSDIICSLTAITTH